MSNKDREEITVTGTITRVFFYKETFMGANLEVMREKSNYPDKYTIWEVKNRILSVGDRVKVRGVYSDRAKSYEKKDGSTGYNVERSINFPEFLKQDETVDQVQVEEIPYSDEPPVDSWDTAALGEDEVPF